MTAPAEHGGPAHGQIDAAAQAARSDAAARSTARAAKFRQAAFVYLHVGILYEAAVLVLWRQGLVPTDRGPVWLWLAIGAGIVLLVFWALWRWQNAWAARVIWALHALRLPALVEGAFFPEPGEAIPAGLYIVGLAVVGVNLWMLARAGWDL